MGNQWTRERIIRHLLDREAEGKRLTVGGEGVDLRLYNAARRIFGSWRNAVKAAGIAPERVLPWERWTPARILTIIRHLAQREPPITLAQKDRRYSNVVSAARRHFGSWSKAVMAAGVDPTRLRRVVPWNQERVIESILIRALRNESLVSRFVEPRSLVEAAQRLYGSWAAAVTAAGLDPKVTVLPPRPNRRSRPARSAAPSIPLPHKPRQLWTKEMVIAAIQARLRSGQSMRPRALAREDSGLYGAARRHLKTWCNALHEAGLDPDEYHAQLRKKDPSAVSDASEPQGRPSQGNDGMRPDRPV